MVFTKSYWSLRVCHTVFCPSFQKFAPFARDLLSTATYSTLRRHWSCMSPMYYDVLYWQGLRVCVAISLLHILKTADARLCYFVTREMDY